MTLYPWTKTCFKLGDSGTFDPESGNCFKRSTDTISLSINLRAFPGESLAM